MTLLAYCIHYCPNDLLSITENSSPKSRTPQLKALTIYNNWNPHLKILALLFPIIQNDYISILIQSLSSPHWKTSFLFFTCKLPSFPSKWGRVWRAEVQKVKCSEGEGQLPCPSVDLHQESANFKFLSELGLLSSPDTMKTVMVNFSVTMVTVHSTLSYQPSVMISGELAFHNN